VKRADYDKAFEDLKGKMEGTGYQLHREGITLEKKRTADENFMSVTSPDMPGFVHIMHRYDEKRGDRLLAEIRKWYEDRGMTMMAMVPLDKEEKSGNST